MPQQNISLKTPPYIKIRVFHFLLHQFLNTLPYGEFYFEMAPKSTNLFEIIVHPWHLIQHRLSTKHAPKLNFLTDKLIITAFPSSLLNLPNRHVRLLDVEQNVLGKNRNILPFSSFLTISGFNLLYLFPYILYTSSCSFSSTATNVPKTK